MGAGDKKYYISMDGQPYGPYTIPEVHSYFKAGNINANTWVFVEGWKNWILLGQVDELLFMVNEHYQEKFQNCYSDPKLFKKIQKNATSKDDKKQKEAAANLCQLTLDVEKRLGLMKGGAGNWIHAILSRAKDHDALRSSAIAFVNLCTSVDCHRELVLQNGLASIQSLIKSSKSDLKSFGALAVSYLTATSTNHQSIIDIGGVDALVALTTYSTGQGNLEFMQVAAVGLENMSVHENVDAKAIMTALIPLALSSDLECQESALKAMLCMSRRPEHATTLISNGQVIALLASLKKKGLSEKARTDAGNILSGLNSKVKESKQNGKLPPPPAPSKQDEKAIEEQAAAIATATQGDRPKTAGLDLRPVTRSGEERGKDKKEKKKKKKKDKKDKSDLGNAFEGADLFADGGAEPETAEERRAKEHAAEVEKQKFEELRALARGAAADVVEQQKEKENKAPKPPSQRKLDPLEGGEEEGRRRRRKKKDKDKDKDADDVQNALRAKLVSDVLSNPADADKVFQTRQNPNQGGNSLPPLK